jgi:hypothetical protein
MRALRRQRSPEPDDVLAVRVLGESEFVAGRTGVPPEVGLERGDRETGFLEDFPVQSTRPERRSRSANRVGLPESSERAPEFLASGPAARLCVAEDPRDDQLDEPPELPVARGTRLLAAIRASEPDAAGELFVVAAQPPADITSTSTFS